MGKGRRTVRVGGRGGSEKEGLTRAAWEATDRCEKKKLSAVTQTFGNVPILDKCLLFMVRASTGEGFACHTHLFLSFRLRLRLCSASWRQWQQCSFIVRISNSDELDPFIIVS